MDFVAVVDQAIALLRQRGRLTYGTLKRQFQLDDAAFDDLKDELMYGQRLAADEEGRVLVWTGGTSSAPPPASPAPLPATPEQRPAQGETAPIAPPRPDAERRQLTVLFCDLVDSTRLSQHLDAEDYRAVVRAYQEAAVTALQPWNGYVAQYLDDGLMVYFGRPIAYEDAAVRAVHAGLALLAALEPLNATQLAPRYGVRVQVRLGVHTGMAVIGNMGGGDRH